MKIIGEVVLSSKAMKGMPSPDQCSDARRIQHQKLIWLQSKQFAVILTAVSSTPIRFGFANDRVGFGWSTS